VSFWRRLSFNLWYLRRPPWDSGISPPELLAFLDSHPAGRAIDLGCGSGTNVFTLAQRGWKVVGVDFAPRAIAIAKRKAQKANIFADLRIGDVTKLNGIDGPFDFALDLGCFHGLSAAERGAYLGTLMRILAPGGHWFMYSFFRSAPNQAPRGLSEADLERIQTQLRLVSRQDGFDKRQRASAYLLFQKES
jgi:SAM-dependent methyltransferase